MTTYEEDVEKEMVEVEAVLETEPVETVEPVAEEEAKPQENPVIRQVTVSLLANEGINIALGTHGMTRLEASAMLSKAFTALNQQTV